MEDHWFVFEKTVLYTSIGAGRESKCSLCDSIVCLTEALTLRRSA